MIQEHMLSEELKSHPLISLDIYPARVNTLTTKGRLRSELEKLKRRLEELGAREVWAASGCLNRMLKQRSCRALNIEAVDKDYSKKAQRCLFRVWKCFLGWGLRYDCEARPGTR
ncbi:MAG: hypothetical protein QXM12_02325 [Nitrososphaerota archaeon]